MAQKTYDYALNLLSARAYTTRNLRRKLVQKEFEADEVDATIERLTASGLLDDRKYAAEFARYRLVVRGSSARRVEQDLARRGIDRETAKAALQGVMEDEPVDALSAIDRLARKKLLSLDGLDPEVKRRRLFGFLARRGYELEDIKRITSHLLR